MTQSGLRRETIERNGKTSIIIATHNEGDNLVRTVDAVVSTCWDIDYELIIADDASTDNSVDQMLNHFQDVKVVRNKVRKGAAGAKSLGADNASGDCLVFLDGHTNPSEGALATLVEDVWRFDGEHILTPQIAMIDEVSWTNSSQLVGFGYRIVLSRPGSKWMMKDKMRQSSVACDGYLENPALIGCCLGISTALYKTLRGFDRDMRSWGVEDTDLGLKCWLMGHQIIANPSIVVGHRFRRKFDNYSVPHSHLTANRMRMARKNYTESVWDIWLRNLRERYTRAYGEKDWFETVDFFESQRCSLEEERAYLMANRRFDEFWYAERFDCKWPRINDTRESDEAFEMLGQEVRK